MHPSTLAMYHGSDATTKNRGSNATTKYHGSDANTVLGAVSTVCLHKLDFCVQVSVADFSGYLSRLIKQ